MDASDKTNPRMMWLSGPAGAGKSAIMQTIAERCQTRGVMAVNFFFKSDHSRSSVQPLVATLLHQILQIYSPVQTAIATVLSQNPLICRASVQDQFTQLFRGPFDAVEESSSSKQPIVLIFDGLDECDSQTKHSQRHILQALDSLLVESAFPFLVLVASRTEPQMTTAFNQTSSVVESVFLDDRYRPQDDIHRFVTAEFNTIKASHHLANILDSDWPSVEDIASIVEKSSSQIIYAATVMRYLMYSSQSPALGLAKVHGIVPATKKSPFAQLDAIYTSILSEVDDQEAVKDLLSATLLDQRLGSLVTEFNMNFAALILLPSLTNMTYHALTTGISIQRSLRHYNQRYTTEVLRSCFSDLSALVRVVDNGRGAELYHASFSDYLKDQARSGEYWCDLAGLAASIFPSICRNYPPSGENLCC
jgi:hypothetical protein